MTNAEVIRILLFIFFVGLVFGISFLILIKQFFFPWMRQETEPRKPISTTGKLFLTAAFAGILCMFYAHWIEPFWLDVTRVAIQSPKLSGASRPIKLAHISDLHCDPTENVEPQMIAAIAQEKPDFIVFTGDTMNEATALPVLKRTLTSLAKIAPTYVVKGNWDAWYYSKIDLFSGTGVRELNDESVKIEVAGTSLYLVGVPVSKTLNFEQAFRGVPPEAFKILLHHYPDEMETAKQQKVDLYCAGHTHGGQIALPFYGALVTFSRFGKKYESGLFQEDGTSLYVNRGMGIEAHPRFRFFSRPEVTIIEIN